MTAFQLVNTTPANSGAGDSPKVAFDKINANFGLLNTGPVTFPSLVVGSPTGGNEGAGTINAQGIFINGVAVVGGGVASVTGTANQIAAAPTTGAVVLSLPQNVVIPTPASGVSLTVPQVAGGIAINITGTAATQLVPLQFQQSGQTQWLIYQPASSSDLRFFAGGDRVVFSAAGNVTINAPTSGTALAVVAGASANGIVVTQTGAAAIPLLLQATGNATNGQGQIVFDASGNMYIENNLGTAMTVGSFVAGSTLALETGGAARININSTGAVTINAPTAGTTLNITGLTGNNALVVNDGTAQTIAAFNSTNAAGGYIHYSRSGTDIGFIGDASVLDGGTLDDFCIRGKNGLDLSTNNGTQRVHIATAGNVTINAPTSGTTLTLTGASAGAGLLVAVHGVSPTAIAVTGDAAQQLNALSITQGAQAAWFVYQSASDTALRFFTGSDRVVLPGTGGMTINAPASGNALNVTGVAGSYAAELNGSSTSGNSFGLLIDAGTTSADWAMLLQNQSASTNFMKVFGDGGVLLGAATGGDKGLGTLNATNLYINGVAVTAGSGTIVVAHKTTATTITSSTTLTADPHLTMTLGIGNWELEFFLQVIDNAAGASGGFKASFGGTAALANTLVPVISYGSVNGAALAMTNSNYNTAPFLSVATVSSNVAAQADTIIIKTIAIVSTGGTVTLNWAQASSAASGTQLLGGSTMTATQT